MGCLSVGIRVAGVLVALLAVILVALIVHQRFAQRRFVQRTPPPGELFDVGGHKLHLHCIGSGTPTVVIDAVRDLEKQ